MLRLLYCAIIVAVVAVAGCKKAAPPPDEGVAPVDQHRPTAIPATELKRGQDACAVLVTRACGCDATGSACNLAKGQVEAIQISLDLVNSATSTHRDILQAQDMLRKTHAHCIEESTKPAEPCVPGGGGSAGSGSGSGK